MDRNLPITITDAFITDVRLNGDINIFCMTPLTGFSTIPPPQFEDRFFVTPPPQLNPTSPPPLKRKDELNRTEYSINRWSIIKLNQTFDYQLITDNQTLLNAQPNKLKSSQI